MERISNEQKAIEIANKEKKYYGNPQYEMRDENWSVHECYQSALQAMKWKEQQMIDKLEDWLANHICNAYNFRGDDISATFIDDCLKAMKGE